MDEQIENNAAQSPGFSLRLRLIVTFCAVILILTSIIFLGARLYKKAMTDAVSLRSILNERLSLVEEVEISFERETSAWRDILLFGYEDQKYHSNLAKFYEQERETRQRLRLLKDDIGQEGPYVLLIQRLIDDHLAKGLALREALRSYNESTSDPYKVTHRFAESTAKDTLRELVAVVRSEYDMAFSEIQSDVDDRELSLVLMTLAFIIVLTILILWVVDKNVGKPVEKAIQLEKSLRSKQNDLLLAIQRADAANKSKEEFLAVMSHELRTPLNPILGFTYLLLDEEADKEKEGMLKSIHDSANHMLLLVEDLLQFSKIESGRQDIHEVEVDLYELCTSVIESVSNSSAAKGLDLHFSPKMDKHHFEEISAEHSIVSDPKVLRQVLLNLVTNACKFTDKGSVTLRVGFKRITSEEDFYRIEVEDTGKGILESDMDRIFDPFTMVDPSSSRNHSGMGLGLAISKRMIDALGGSIGVRSEPGKGSLFWVEFATTTLPSKASIENQSLVSSGVERSISSAEDHILVAEDNPGNQLLIKKMLNRLGHNSCTIVSDGDAAIKEFSEGTYSIILMDLSMPKMNGLDAARHIRKLHAGGRDVPIIAMTAHVSSKDREACIAAGMNGFLPKPISMSDLSNCFSSWL